MKRQGLIIAIEPNPLIRNYLYENLLANKLENISRIDPRLLCGRNGLGELYITEYPALSSISQEYIKIMGERVVRRIKLPCITLSKLIESHRIGKVDVLKLDVEGAELPIIKNAIQSSVLEKSKIRSIIIELHPPYSNMREAIMELIKVMRNNGYEVMEMNPLIPLWNQIIVVLR